MYNFVDFLESTILKIYMKPIILGESPNMTLNSIITASLHHGSLHHGSWHMK
jgi:hypothetical protein